MQTKSRARSRSCQQLQFKQTNISRIVSAGDGEVDDVLVGGGEQGDEEEAENEQDPSEAGVLPVAHICYRFTNNPSWVWPWLATLTLPWPE